MKGIAFLGSLLAVALGATALAGERYALVIGIDGCQHLGKLKTCVADAGPRVGPRLLGLGRRGAEAADGRSIRYRVRQFAQLSEKGDTTLVFSSGHGPRRDGAGPL